MNFQNSTIFTFEKRFMVNEGNYILSLKIPNSVRHYEYQAFGDEGYQYMAEVIVGGVYKKDEKKSVSQNYIYLTIEGMQNIFFQMRIYMEDEKILHYHEFINIEELYKEIKPSVPPVQNVKMVVKEIIHKKEEEEDEEEEDEEDEEDEEEEDEEVEQEKNLR